MDDRHTESLIAIAVASIGFAVSLPIAEVLGFAGWQKAAFGVVFGLVSVTILFILARVG